MNFEPEENQKLYTVQIRKLNFLKSLDSSHFLVSPCTGPPCQSTAAGQFVPWSQGPAHRRRIESEDKAKVVASVWGAECVQFLAALAVFPRSI